MLVELQEIHGDGVVLVGVGAGVAAGADIEKHLATPLIPALQRDPAAQMYGDRTE